MTRPRREHTTWWDRVLDLIDDQQRVDRARQLLHPLLIVGLITLAIIAALMVALAMILGASPVVAGIAALVGGGGATIASIRRGRPRKGSRR